MVWLGSIGDQYTVADIRSCSRRMQTQRSGLHIDKDSDYRDLYYKYYFLFALFKLIIIDKIYLAAQWVPRSFCL